MHRGGRDQQIEIGDALSTPPQLEPGAPENLHHWISAEQGLELRQQRSNALEAVVRINVIECPFVQFAMGDDTDGDPLRVQVIEESSCHWASNIGIDQPIGVDQILHRGLSGREPSSRQR